MSPYYDRQGNSIDLHVFDRLMSNMDYKAVARTNLPNGRIVSTVWLGYDHSYSPSNPMIFETMVFPSEDDFIELDIHRYTSEQDAFTGHLDAVNKWA